MCDVSGVTQPSHGQYGSLCAGTSGNTLSQGASCDLTCDAGYTLQAGSQPGPCDGSTSLEGTATCNANVCTASTGSFLWRDTPGYVITDTCGLEEEGRTTAAINCDDTTCAPGYTGNPEVTCPDHAAGLFFSGCTRDIQGGIFNESKKSDFRNAYDGTMDISWKHILGGLFFLFIFIAIMGFVKV